MHPVAVKKPPKRAFFQKVTGKNATKTVNSGLETGLYYYGARYLDPKTSRWISADKWEGDVNNPLSLSKYAYCFNNPIRYIDPTGNEPEDKTRTIARNIIGNPSNVEKTQNGQYPWLFYLAGFVRTKDLNDTYIYHARQDCLQSHFGYNDFYDTVFRYATSMLSAQFEFSSGNQEYIFWVWKGDYLNLGAGAEFGIYTRGKDIYTFITSIIGYRPDDDHWVVDPNLAMHMTLKLLLNGETIIDWDPAKDKYFPSNIVWWLTSFNPYYQRVKANELTAIFTLDFHNKILFDDFFKTWKDDKRWSFNHETYSASFIF